MHPLFFGVKRVHWRLVMASQVHLSECDIPLTPARLDLLRVVWVHSHGIARWKLVKLLGVSGPVVSRMLKALEADGLVRRHRAEHDARLVIVTLTRAGWELVRDALQLSALDFEHYALRFFTARSANQEQELAIFERYLHRARVELRDPAPFPHPWRKDNLFTLDLRPVTLASQPPLYALTG